MRWLLLYVSLLEADACLTLLVRESADGSFGRGARRGSGMVVEGAVSCVCGVCVRGGVFVVR